MNGTEIGSCGKNLCANSQGVFEGEWLHWIATAIPPRAAQGPNLAESEHCRFCGGTMGSA